VMEPNLGSINVPLWIMAAVSVLEALVIIGVAIGGFIVYRRLTQTLSELEARQIAPLRAKVEHILEDVQSITDRLNTQTERVDHAIVGTMERVDETAERVKHSVRDKVAQATGVVRGVRAVIMSLLGADSESRPHAEAAGRV
jgi:uncharacterized protein YoxC